MRTGEESQHGWRRQIEVAGLKFDVFADHRTRQRMPRGSEFAKMAARGRPFGFEMVKETVEQWGVSNIRARVLTIERSQNGGYRCGVCNIRPGTPFLKAVEEIIRRILYLPVDKPAQPSSTTGTSTGTSTTSRNAGTRTSTGTTTTATATSTITTKAVTKSNPVEDSSDSSGSNAP